MKKINNTQVRIKIRRCKQTRYDDAIKNSRLNRINFVPSFKEVKE